MYSSPPATTGLVPGFRFDHAVCSRAPANVHTAVPARSATKSQVASLERSTAGAEETGPGWRRHGFDFHAAMRGGTGDLRQRQEADLSVFATLRDHGRREGSQGEVDPTSRSVSSSASVFVGVSLATSCVASVSSTSVASPQFDPPSQGPFPVATRDLASRIDDRACSGPDRRTTLRT